MTTSKIQLMRQVLAIFGIILVLIVLATVIFRSELVKCVDIFLWTILAIAIATLSVYLTGLFEFEKKIAAFAIRGGGAIGLLASCLYFIFHNYNIICECSDNIEIVTIEITRNDVAEILKPYRNKRTGNNYSTNINRSTGGNYSKFRFDSPETSLLDLIYYCHIEIPNGAKQVQMKVDDVSLTSSLSGLETDTEGLFIIGLDHGVTKGDLINARSLDRSNQLSAFDNGSRTDFNTGWLDLKSAQDSITVVIQFHDRWVAHSVDILANDINLEFR